MFDGYTVLILNVPPPRSTISLCSNSNENGRATKFTIANTIDQAPKYTYVNRRKIEQIKKHNINILYNKQRNVLKGIYCIVGVREEEIEFFFRVGYKNFLSVCRRNI